MKSVCQFCGGKSLIKWGNRRRKCSLCCRTFRVKKVGRNRIKFSEMYLLDRSTLRRISDKTKFSPAEIMRKIMLELKGITTPIFYTKNFTNLQRSAHY